MPRTYSAQSAHIANIFATLTDLIVHCRSDYKHSLPDGDILIRGDWIIRYSNNIPIVETELWYSYLYSYSYSYSEDIFKLNNICIHIRVISKTEYYSCLYSVKVLKPKSKNFKVSVATKAQLTQYAIFSFLSFNIFCFLMFLYSYSVLFVFGIIQIQIRSKVALQITFVIVFGHYKKHK